MIDQITHLSGAFIGGVMLAAVTSLPELFTALSSTILLKKPELVIGNILGSNIFNLTVLASLVVILYKKISSAYIAKSHTKVTLWLIFIYALLTLPMFFNQDLMIFRVSLISLVIALVYIICIKEMAEDTSEARDTKITVTLTKNQVFTRFALFSLLLVISSIGITYVSDMVAIELNLDITLAGALLLGIATSLPELASCITLAKLGNFDAMVGNILGSNIFNLFILFLADLSYKNGSIYTPNQQSYYLVLFGAISMLAILAILLAKTYKDKLSRKTNQAIYVGGGMIPIIGYLLFLSLSR